MSAIGDTQVETVRSNENPVLELDDIGKSYGNVHALRG
jgi:ABC-type sugar transport system ATPase subunit